MDFNETPPEDWQIIKLGDIANFKTGKLDSNCAENNGTYPFFTCAPEPSKINSFAFDYEAVLLAGNNANGIFHVHYYNGKFNAYQRTYVITPSVNQRLDLKYLYHFLYLTLNLLKDVSQGTATKFLTMKILENLKILLPPFEEQKKISNILWNIENKILINEEMIATLEKIGQAIFKHWFIDFEFPNDEGKPYRSNGGEMVDSELGKIPKRGEIKRLGDFSIHSKKNGAD